MVTRDPRDHDQPGVDPRGSLIVAGGGAAGLTMAPDRRASSAAGGCWCRARRGRCRRAAASSRTSSPSSASAPRRYAPSSTSPRCEPRTGAARRADRRLFARARDAAIAGAAGVLRRGPLPLPGVGARGAAADELAFDGAADVRQMRRGLPPRPRAGVRGRASRASTSNASTGRAGPTARLPKPSRRRWTDGPVPRRRRRSRPRRGSAASGRWRRRACGATRLVPGHAARRPGDRHEPTHDRRRLPGVDARQSLRPAITCSSSGVGCDGRVVVGWRRRRRRGCRLRPGAAGGPREPLREHRARDDEHAAASGRSAVLNMARDFSCSIITSDNELLASAEGLPVHVIGTEFLADAMTELHPDFVEGDAYLHNDPLPRQHASGRPRDPRPRLHRGRARVHRVRQGAPGRLRQRAADDLHARGDATSTRRAR